MIKKVNLVKKIKAIQNMEIMNLNSISTSTSQGILNYKYKLEGFVISILESYKLVTKR